jgi:hypothetical protein
MSLPLLFSTFKISGQVFYQSKLSLGLVNLKPLTPGRRSEALSVADAVVSSVGGASG